MSGLAIKDVTKQFGDFTAVDDDQPRRAARHIRLPARPVRLRQDHAAAHDRRPRRADQRRDHARRPGHHADADAQAQSRHGVPVAGAVSASVGRRQHRLCAAHPRRVARRAEEARRRTAEDGASAGLCRPPGRQALRRAAPACGDRPGAGALAKAVPARRAAVGARRQAARGHAGGAAPVAAAARHHHDRRHPRPARGDDHGRPRRGDGRRQDPPGRRADRDLPQAGRRLRRRLHRLDQPARRDSRQRRAAPPFSASPFPGSRCRPACPGRRSRSGRKTCISRRPAATPSPER